MKTYFLVHRDRLPWAVGFSGTWHGINLDSHGNAKTDHWAIVVDGPTDSVPTDWHELPHVLDAKTTMSHPDHAHRHAHLAHVGVLPDHTGYALARVLASIHPGFKP